jgi:oleandomycin transport system ATP-binding protein
MDTTIEAHGLVKRFGDTTALGGVDLAARTGTVLAVLGPNGAGKTTAVRILATLLEPDEGRARVAGYDVVAQAQQVRRLIALTGQYAAVDESLTGAENLLLIGRLLGLPRAAASTWPPAWSAGPGCCTWTSRPPAWTPGPATTCGG